FISSKPAAPAATRSQGVARAAEGERRTRPVDAPRTPHSKAGARRRTSLSAGPGAAFRRIARHKGGAVAVFATARQLARLIYRMLRYGHNYVDIGEQAYDRRFQIRRLAALTETAKSLGYTLVPNVAAGGSFRSVEVPGYR